MKAQGQNQKTRAFALPTVLIASVVLLTVLAVSVTATAAVRTTLKNQYYSQLAQIAGEAGVAYAKACLAANGNIPLWTNAKPLTPATDCSGNVILSPTVKTLVVAGGGSGGGSTGGGGGGGGVIYSDSVGITATSYPIVIGAGGTSAAQLTTGKSGANSSFNGLTAIGGGGGGYSANSTSGGAGLNGGSGGGGQNYYGSYAPGTGTAGQGYAGGPLAGSTTAGTGGGGAGGIGGTGSGASVGGVGGIGIVSTISGSSVYYGGGGGGGSASAAVAGGSGGGGAGAGGAVGTAGTANTGGGGGGGWAYSGGVGGAGGSGIVIISYPTNSGITATGIRAPSNTVVTPTTSGGNTIFRFTGNGTFTVASAGTATCPLDSRCSVTVIGNARSSFSVPKPTVDATSGQAITIPNSGYVEITRSTYPYAVWRTYNQPSVQAAVVPDLCSGNATAARGWNAAVRVTSQNVLPSASSAQTISIADAPINAGVVYFRKDFNVSTTAAYDLNVYTSTTLDSATTYIDGLPINTAAGSVATSQTTLTAGCHVMVTKLVNQTYAARAADFTASLTRQGAATPIVVSDTTWRVTSGDSTHFSTNNYYESTSAWEQVAVLGVWNNTALAWAGNPTNWASVSGDALGQYISTKANTNGSVAPGNSYALFRSTQPFTLASPTTVRVSTYCDNGCELYLDGSSITSGGPFTSGMGSSLISKNITIQAGSHTFGIRLYNGSNAANTAGFLFSAVDTTTSQVYSRGNVDWDGTTSWSSSAVDSYSYDTTYVPVPAVQTTSNAKVLVIGAGGGGGSDMGGGGGGGAVVSNAAYPLSAGTYTVTVGGGGTGGFAGQGMARGTNGGNSLFGTVRALGGGGGASEYADNRTPPGSGASAGGSAGYGQTWRAAGAIGQGYDSVPSVNPAAYYPTGGGGAGGAGATNPATGGVGMSNNFLGVSYFFGGGGGGSGYTGIGGNGGAGGGGGGAVGVTTGGSGIYSGSPGGGGTTVAQTNKPGGPAGNYTGGGGGGGSHYNATNSGGNGGGGLVVISFPVGAVSVSATGAYVDVSAGVTPFTTGTPGFTTYAFYGSGTFTVTAVNS